MTTPFDRLMNETFNHWNNPTHKALVAVSYGEQRTPLMQLNRGDVEMNYPINKLFMSKVFLTDYDALEVGDFAEIDGDKLVVRVVHENTTFGLFRVIVEKEQ